MSFQSNEIIVQARNALEMLRRHYRNGAYRAIRNPDGVVSLWAIESSPATPFSLSFVEKGRVYNRIEDVPEDMLKSFVAYVLKSVR